MSDRGGGAEGRARANQYDYKANSGLVLASGDRQRDAGEPTGEPLSLDGRMGGNSFGDKAARRKPNDSASEKRRGTLGGVEKRKRRRIEEESMLNSAEEGGFYRPKTMETRAAHEGLLAVIQQQLGGQPPNILFGAAEEVLAVLKNDSIKNPDKKKAVDGVLTVVPDIMFDQLVSIARLITDYCDGGDEDCWDNAVDDDVGVAVEFEEDEESDLDMVQEDEEEDDDATEEPYSSSAMQMAGRIDYEDLEEANAGMGLNVQDIDAYWLQRRISMAYDQQMDPEQCQKLAEEALVILSSGDDREVEAKLLLHLQFDKFSLVKFLTRNRLKIVWCTCLARVVDQEERNKIEEEMMGLGSELAAIVEQLHATRQGSDGIDQ